MYMLFLIRILKEDWIINLCVMWSKIDKRDLLREFWIDCIEINKVIVILNVIGDSLFWNYFEWLFLRGIDLYFF